MIKSLWQKANSNTRLAELFRFAVAGGVGFIVDYGLMVALKEWVGLHYLLAAGISFTISVVVNYLMCVAWVFRGIESPQAKTTVFFLLTSIAGLLWNEFFMWLFVDIINIHYMIAKVIATILVMLWNYITKRKVLVK